MFLAAALVLLALAAGAGWWALNESGQAKLAAEDARHQKDEAARREAEAKRHEGEAKRQQVVAQQTSREAQIAQSGLLRSLLGDQLPDLSTTGRSGSFGVKFERS